MDSNIVSFTMAVNKNRYRLENINYSQYYPRTIDELQRHPQH